MRNVSITCDCTCYRIGLHMCMTCYLRHTSATAATSTLYLHDLLCRCRFLSSTSTALRTRTFAAISTSTSTVPIAMLNMPPTPVVGAISIAMASAVMAVILNATSKKINHSPHSQTLSPSSTIEQFSLNPSDPHTIRALSRIAATQN